jgi:hypothetical protein
MLVAGGMFRGVGVGMVVVRTLWSVTLTLSEVGVISQTESKNLYYGVFGVWRFGKGIG